MNEKPRWRRIARNAGLLVAFLGARAGLFLLSLAILFFPLFARPSEWSARVDSETPCTLVITFGDGGEQPVRIERFEVQRSPSYSAAPLVRERGETWIHTIEAFDYNGRQQLVTLDKRLPAGSDLSISIDERLKISTSIDYDANM